MVPCTVVGWLMWRFQVTVSGVHNVLQSISSKCSLPARRMASGTVCE